MEYCGRYIPMELQTTYSKKLKKRRFADVEVFVDNFTDGITEGFKPGSSCSDVTNSPSKLPTESPTQEVCRWFHQQKWIYHHSADPFLPYIYFFFPISTLPSQTANNHPPKKKTPLLNTSHISLSFVVTTSMFWFIVDFIIFYK
jgi:hypothetical protein